MGAKALPRAPAANTRGLPVRVGSGAFQACLRSVLVAERAAAGNGVTGPGQQRRPMSPSEQLFRRGQGASLTQLPPRRGAAVASSSGLVERSEALPEPAANQRAAVSQSGLQGGAAALMRQQQVGSGVGLTQVSSHATSACASLATFAVAPAASPEQSLIRSGYSEQQEGSTAVLMAERALGDAQGRHAIARTPRARIGQLSTWSLGCGFDSAGDRTAVDMEPRVRV